MFFAQITETAQVLEEAGKHGWESAMIAFVVLSCFAAIAFMFRSQNLASLKREERMATRIDGQDATIARMESEHSKINAALTERVTGALSEATQAIREMRETLARLDNTQSAVNGDLRDLITRMDGCPCLLFGRFRDKYKIIEIETGKHVDLRAVQDEGETG